MSQQTLTLIWLIAVGAIFYFMILRPQQQRQRETREMQEAVKVGDRIVTIGGMYGTIRGLDEDTITLEVAPSVRVIVARMALGKIVTGGVADED